MNEEVSKNESLSIGQLLRAVLARIRSADEFDSRFCSRCTQNACCRRSGLSKRTLSPRLTHEG